MQSVCLHTLHPPNMDTQPLQELNLPGFRFHPTDGELLTYYLEPVAKGNKLPFHIIDTANVYAYDPSELPGLAKLASEKEWYFFVPRDKRKQNGMRPNRIARNGFWKATGSDKVIRNASDPKSVLGLRKTLVYYKGKAPKGCKTDWIMNEYRMPDGCLFPKDIVLCKIHLKATPRKVLEQWANEMSAAMNQTIQSTTDTCSFSEREFSPCLDLKNEIVEDDPIENRDDALSNTTIEQYQIAWLKADTNEDPLDSLLANLQVEIPAAMNQGTHSTTETGSSSELEFSSCMDLKAELVHDDMIGSSWLVEDSNQHSLNSFMANLPTEMSAAMNQAIHSLTENCSLKQFKANLPELQLPLINSNRMPDPFLLYSPWMDFISPANRLIESLGPHISPTLFLS